MAAAAEPDDHRVAGCDIGDARPDRADDPGALMAEHHRHRHWRKTVAKNEVGVAEAYPRNLDQHLAFLRCANRQRLDSKVVSRRRNDRGSDVHKQLLSGGGVAAVGGEFGSGDERRGVAR